MMEEHNNKEQRNAHGVDALFLLAKRKIADIDVSEIRKRVEIELADRPMWFSDIIRDLLPAFSSRFTHVGVRHAA